MQRFLNQIICGDCLGVMRDMPDNSIDAVVTDPPYELGFMGKKWDSTGIAYKVDLWQEVLRVLKPGGYLLAFGGTRTYHRMACAIEDAGFETHPMIAWIYGSGFPKATNLGKQFDKQAGVERKILGYSKRNDRKLANLALLNTSPGAGGSTPKGIPLSCLAFMQDIFSHSFRRQGLEGVQFILLFFHQVCQVETG